MVNVVGLDAPPLIVPTDGEKPPGSWADDVFFLVDCAGDADGAADVEHDSGAFVVGLDKDCVVGARLARDLYAVDFEGGRHVFCFLGLFIFSSFLVSLLYWPNTTETRLIDSSPALSVDWELK